MPAPCLVRVACAALLSTGVAAVSMAQAPPGVSFSVAPVVQFASDLDSGGDAAYAAVLMSLGTNWALDGQSSLGVRLRLDYEDWHFDKPLGFGGEQLGTGSTERVSPYPTALRPRAAGAWG